jgi:hypothetical protein
MSETPRTDVGVDYWINTGELTELRDISEEMEHELFRANDLIKDCLAAMPVGYIPTHTRENLPSMIADLARELAEETQNSEKLEKELASMTQQRDALIMFLECEMNWMFFRAEYQLGENPTQHELNGNKVREYLQSKGWEAK